jgi:hypothetical protein
VDASDAFAGLTRAAARSRPDGPWWREPADVNTTTTAIATATSTIAPTIARLTMREW